MDNEIFRTSYHDINEQYCPYEKAILTGQCHCPKGERFCIAEREGMQCLSAEAQEGCLRYLEYLRKQAKFALRNDSGEGKLPHGQAMRIQVGGVRGLSASLNEADDLVEDIYGVLQRAFQKYGGLEAFPYSDILQYVAAYERPKRKRRKDR